MEKDEFDEAALIAFKQQMDAAQPQLLDDQKEQLLRDIEWVRQEFKKRHTESVAHDLFKSVAYSVLLITKLLVAPEKRNRRVSPALHGLARVAGLLGPQTRKSIQAMAADYAVEIHRMHMEGRIWAARWHSVLAWVYAGKIFLARPFERALDLLRRMWRST